MPQDDSLLRPDLGDLVVTDSALADVLGGLDAFDRSAGPSSSAPALVLGVPAGGLDALALDTLALCGLPATVLGDPASVTLKPGATTVLPVIADLPVAELVLVGTGVGGADDLRRAGAGAGRAGRGRAELVTAVPTSGATVAAFVEGLLLGGHTAARRTGGGISQGGGATRVTHVVAGERAEQGSKAAAAGVRARASVIARNLSNTPSNIKNPEWMAARARRLAKDTGLEVRVWNEAALRREGFGGLLAVGGGSVSPPRFVQLTWAPEGATEHVVLVGKGITFDTGGVNVKPAAGMDAMRTDMSGSAIVLAVLGACGDLGVDVMVTGLLPLAENAFGESSYRPDDVVTHYGGRTSEIGNTDAEGRVVLADALAYADLHLDPDVLIDVATLTGAARVALARSMAPVYSVDEVLRDELVEAGRTAGEPFWPFPLHEDYREQIASDIADVNNAGQGGAGSITAALFLKDFVGSRRWAHLDIAGPGRSDADTGILARGATGYGARALLTWLEGRS
ncbi:leucyl aminopeptidase family protein [Janibacter sp. G56]|uniref:leucyl aminopeptidase family protein n=1 Tax=Janibacter sp. G56 TaxID=3418717 RepID=UPI003D041EED